ADPAGHIVVTPLPRHLAALIPDLSQPFDEFVNARRTGQRMDRLDIGDAVESLERSREHFRCCGRANQRVYLVGESEELAGKNVDSAAGGTVRLRLRNERFDAPPAKTLWLRVFHRILILARASDTASISDSP